jgi:sigma-E factor negative regulatory protein RseA
MNVERRSYEQLSAFIDGDMAAGAGPFARRLVSDEGLSAGWQRYHFIGDCLRREAPLIDTRLTATVLQRIAEEPTVIAPAARHDRGHRDGRWTRWAGGAAIAASVAAVVVIGVTQLETPTEGLVQQQTPATAPSVVAAPVEDEQAGWNVQHPEVASKLNRYLANHSDFASRGSLNGMTPLATFVSYDE